MPSPSRLEMNLIIHRFKYQRLQANKNLVKISQNII